MPFDGLRVLSLESRRAAEIERLIRAQGGVPVVAPSMREVPLTDNPQAFDFAAKLLGGEVDMVILLTGVGTRLLNQVIETRWPPGTFIEALQQIPVVARGPKPAGVLREWGVPVAIMVPEPNTWREILTATEGRTEEDRCPGIRPPCSGTDRRSSGAGRGSDFGPGLPMGASERPGASARSRARDCAGRIRCAAADVCRCRSSTCCKVAAEKESNRTLRRALPRIVIASIGPTTSETLAELGLAVDFEPSHPKMGLLVNETAQQARLAILQSKSSEQTKAARRLPGVGGALYGRRDDAACRHVCRLPDRLRAGLLAAHHVPEDRILDPGDRQRFRAVDPPAHAGHGLEAEMIELSYYRYAHHPDRHGAGRDRRRGRLWTCAGPRDAVGFLVGAGLSLITVRSWFKLADAIGASGKLPAAGSVVFLVVRYLLIAGAVYATIYVLRSSPAVLIMGLLVSFFAVVLELLFGLSVSK